MPGGTGRRREASQIREASPSASEGSREVPGGAGRRTALILMQISLTNYLCILYSRTLGESVTTEEENSAQNEDVTQLRDTITAIHLPALRIPPELRPVIDANALSTDKLDFTRLISTRRAHESVRVRA